MKTAGSGYSREKGVDLLFQFVSEGDSKDLNWKQWGSRGGKCSAGRTRVQVRGQQGGGQLLTDLLARAR